MYLSDEFIMDKLNSLPEHKMAKDIFVPLLKKKGLSGVKFTGGSEEEGIDIEYYEESNADNTKQYAGIQFKKGDITYSSRGTNGTVKDLKNQAEEAFAKDICDVNSGGVNHISRFIVATTGAINENARKMINKARNRGEQTNISYWDSSKLANDIRNYFYAEFIDYFSIEEEEIKELHYEDSIVTSNYIEENGVNFAMKDIQKSALAKFEKNIMESMLKGIVCKRLERKIEIRPILEDNQTVYKIHITEYHQLQLLSDEAHTAIRNHRFRFISQKQNDSFNLKAMIVNSHNYQNELANYVQKQSAMNNTDSNSVGNRTFNYVINVSLPMQPKNLREIEYKIEYEYDNYEMGTYLTSALNYPTYNINEVYSIIGEHAQKYIIHGFSHFPYHSQPGEKIHFKRINFSSLQILISNDWQLPGSGSSVVVRKRNEQSEILN